ncbi:hypothetical protein, partial [Sansalvadorimonas verongulae]|uniref:hypothetical protein n=1 Tax=Sansalvadorimonas verongulae TaxID=2172824 RepID=UPI001E3A3E3D
MNLLMGFHCLLILISTPGKFTAGKVVKQEVEEVYETVSIVPGDLGYDSSIPEVEILSQREKGAVCKRKRNTTCFCGTTFASVTRLNSHRQCSREPQCKGQWNTTCACGVTFASVSLLNSHCQGSSDARCKGR